MLDFVTGVASRGLVEIATDPFPNTKPACSSVDQNHIIWAHFLGGGETADMCDQQQGTDFEPDDFDHHVQCI